MRYEQIEDALADVMNIRPGARGAFRARLRHLRNIGCPRLPKTGSGRAIDYSREHALEMLLALEMEDLGQAPKRVALLAPSMARQLPYGESQNQECYVLCRAKARDYTTAYGPEQLKDAMRKAPHAFLLINVSDSARRLDMALNKAVLRR